MKKHGDEGIPWDFGDPEMPLKYLEKVAIKTAHEVYQYGELMNLGKNLAIGAALCEAYTVGWDQCLDLTLHKAGLLSKKEHKASRWHPGINLPKASRAKPSKRPKRSRAHDSGASSRPNRSKVRARTRRR